MILFNFHTYRDKYFKCYYVTWRGYKIGKIKWNVLRKFWDKKQTALERIKWDLYLT